LSYTISADILMDMTTPRDNSIDEILAEEYLGVGVIGKVAIHALWEDFAEGRMNEWLEETETTRVELLEAMLRLTTDIVGSGKVDMLRTMDGWETYTDAQIEAV